MTNYTRLCEAVLASIILFNRRRPGETSRLTVKAYLERDQEVNEDILEHLSALEKELCKSLGYVVVRGKKGRGVPMMLTGEIRGALDQLIASRGDVGISAECPYVFVSGTAPDAAPLRGSDCVRKVSKHSCVTNVTATNYRKHVATMLQLLQLGENEMDIVATYMGHDIRVHRKFYRLPDKTVHAAKVAKILLAMDSGMSQFAGASLDDLNPPISGTGDRSSAPEPGDDMDCAVPESGTGCADNAPPARPERCAARTKVLRGGPRNLECDSDSGSEPDSSGCSVKRKSRGTVGLPPRKRVSKCVWSQEEKAAIQRQLGTFITSFQCPGAKDCHAALRAEPVLSNRSWKAVKYCTYNMMQKHKRAVGVL